MFIFANFFEATANLLNIALTLYMYILIARVILSWIRVDPYNQIVQFIFKITDPALMRIRQFIPPLGGLDLSPLVLIIGIQFVKSFLVKSLFDLASSLS